MIKPQVGQVVQFFSAEGDYPLWSGGTPLAAIVCMVYPSGDVRLNVCDRGGQWRLRDSIHVRQPEERLEVPSPFPEYCEHLTQE